MLATLRKAFVEGALVAVVTVAGDGALWSEIDNNLQMINFEPVFASAYGLGVVARYSERGRFNNSFRQSCAPGIRGTTGTW